MTHPLRPRLEPVQSHFRAEEPAGPPPAPPPLRPALAHALRVGLTAYRELLVILVPTYVAVTLLKHSPALPWLTAHLSPLMGHFGLPGAAALPMVLGLLLGLYAAVAALAGLGLAPGEVTTLALMLGLCHNLIVETGLLMRMRAHALAWTLVRVATAAALGALLGPWLAGGKP
jgi:spore maturation protein SpmB